MSSFPALFLIIYEFFFLYWSISPSCLSVSLIFCCWRQILDEFRFRFYVRLINNPSTYTHTQFQFFFFFFFSQSTSVRRTGVKASYHLCKCVCVHFFLSKHSFFIRTYCNFGHTYIYIYRADGLKENEINGCRLEFESTICIIDFCFILIWL